MELHAAPIALRWLHLASAATLVGSVFFFDIVLPRATGAMEAAEEEAVYLRCRRGFKMTVHVCLLLLLISGIYNALQNWPVYTDRPAIMHGLFGLHLLLGLGAIAILMVLLAGRNARRTRGGWIRLALLGLFLGIAAASTLKSARQWTSAHHAVSPSDKGAVKTH